ncbi:MAG: type IV pilin [Methanocalculus sp.]|uniref:type IV pilin n=1 Tax=Methanocalculus sp. TaxID=2004547 RepID=UPI00271F3005|nr:type IV pilin [Methanocalculus sp.]MDO9538784.1 type IV pilin [Methanocalculus sp.]
MHRPQSDDGDSQIQGVVILVAVTFILALLLLLMLHIPLWSAGEAPEIFALSELKHLNEVGVMNYDSRMTIMHVGTAVYRNDELRAEIFVNDQDSGAIIRTMNAHLFIKTFHLGVQRLWGVGSTGYYWYPGSPIYLDMNDNTFRPGDRIRLDVYHKDHGGLISRSVKTA